MPGQNNKKEAKSSTLLSVESVLLLVAPRGPSFGEIYVTRGTENDLPGIEY